MEIVQVVRLSKDYVGQNVPEEYLKSISTAPADAANRRMFVAYEDKQCLGYAFFSPRYARKDTFELVYIYVVPEYEGQNIATAILKFAIEKLSIEGVKKIEAAYPLEDEEEILPYLKFNSFSEIGTITCLNYTVAELKNSLLYKKISKKGYDAGCLQKADSFDTKANGILKNKYGINAEGLPEDARLVFTGEELVGYIGLKKGEMTRVEDYCIFEPNDSSGADLNLWGYAVDSITKEASNDSEPVTVVIRNTKDLEIIKSLLGEPDFVEKMKYFSKTI